MVNSKYDSLVTYLHTFIQFRSMIGLEYTHVTSYLIFRICYGHKLKISWMRVEAKNSETLGSGGY